MINKQVKIKVVSSSEELERETSVEFSDIIIWERDRTNINTKEKNGKFECLVTFINKKTELEVVKESKDKLSFDFDINCTVGGGKNCYSYPSSAEQLRSDLKKIFSATYSS